MSVDDQFEFLAPDDIRIKGTRVGIETVLSEYLDIGRTPEQIAERYPHLTIDQIRTTIEYFQQNKAAVTAYLDEIAEWGRRSREQQRAAAPPIVARLRQARANPGRPA